ncbi:MAG: hypothetical protein SV760_03205 [Halobacteria archaeon]|nr:hypothetical protein [Halobacteria archaeon]
MRSRAKKQYAGEGAEEALEDLREHAEEVKEREVTVALNRLSQGGEVTRDEREVIEELADSLVDELLSYPEKGIESCQRSERDAEEVLSELFDL